ncbi:MAG: hypothetical protein V7681_18795 [Halopseudomonas sabulinigri]
MALLRFMTSLVAFIGALAAAAAAVATVVLVMKYPVLLAVLGLACLLFNLWSRQTTVPA